VDSFPLSKSLSIDSLKDGQEKEQDNRASKCEVMTGVRTKGIPRLCHFLGKQQKGANTQAKSVSPRSIFADHILLYDSSFLLQEIQTISTVSDQ